ncbi:hypothetical protein BDQ12DRAFT_690981 [Crucibulum laeve]|uniref:Uncharacterized protein n=1 Tax=Crucibulum laeve TaxID=68775 RepID=A0A5C3LL10_9AGAR|nr:hypothetical protein BDQ12DRAFT_690981 [Crucibulum laeve]
MASSSAIPTSSIFTSSTNTSKSPSPSSLRSLPVSTNRPSTFSSFALQPTETITLLSTETISQNPTSTSNILQSNGTSSLSSTALGVIIAGCVIAVIIIVAIVILLMRHRRQKQAPSAQHKALLKQDVEKMDKFDPGYAGIQWHYPGQQERQVSESVGTAPLLNSHDRWETAEYDVAEQRLSMDLVSSSYHPTRDAPNSPFLYANEEDLGIQQTHARPLSDATPFFPVAKASSPTSPTSPYRPSLSPLRIPEYVAASRTAPRSPPKRSQTVESEDTESMYSQPSASLSRAPSVAVSTNTDNVSAHDISSRPSSTATLRPTLLPVPPARSSLRAVSRDIKPSDREPTYAEPKDLVRGDTRAIAKLLQSRARRTRAASLPQGDGVARRISRIERSGSIKPAVGGRVDQDETSDDEFSEPMEKDRASVQQKRIERDIEKMIGSFEQSPMTPTGNVTPRASTYIHRPATRSF